MIYKIKTTIPKKIIEMELEDKAKNMGFGILHSYDFKKILEGKGFPIERDITVFELCNPFGAQQSLTLIPEISVYLPCRISVYEEDKKTILSTISVEDILNITNLDKDFQELMSSIFEKLKAVMNSWNNK